MADGWKDRDDLRAYIARALLNESEAGGGAFDDMADAVLAALDEIRPAIRPPSEPVHWRTCNIAEGDA